ncbi:IclR family transcriptional regulator [Amycolatopsis sp. GM8]|uniref:IclR family transcriptional regulator n=1 Tax=Amycolatopsis sp. GM8 TaxID=2896530 RepID=UPI001F3664AF|nr:IclR family transcriptional regulator [Amycolatopsis sp. GM8]
MTAVAKTAQNAILILKQLAESGPATAARLSELLELNRTVIHRLLVTLEKHGLVQCTGSTYRLGFGLLPLADSVEINVRSAAQPELQRLADELHESTVLMLADGIDGVHVDQNFSMQEIGPQVRFPAGYRSPLTAAGHGRAILAFSDDWVVSKSLGQLPKTERARISSLLDEAREQGYAESTDELRAGFSGLAVPIRDPNGLAIASIGIVSPSARYPDSSTTIREVKESARRIERRLFDDETFGVDRP